MRRSELAEWGRAIVLVLSTSLLTPLAHGEPSSHAAPGASDAVPSRTPGPSSRFEPGAKNRPPVGMFIDLEWRVYGLGGHISHGPALSAGASFFDGHLRIGFAGLARPGPLNPTTFDVALGEGVRYRGQSTVSLRNDGMMGGLHLGYSTALPFAGAIALQVPVTFGYGGFGYYLTGGDRDTPDGRRVSEWEDELFDGKDSYIGFVLDAGLRLRYQPRTLRWIMPYAGAAFTIVPGFSTVVREDYFGASGLVGLEIGTSR